jgi:hypothetical protein
MANQKQKDVRNGIKGPRLDQYKPTQAKQ